MKIAVTGATGFLGRYVVNTLSREGHGLVASHRPGGSPPFSAENCEWRSFSLESRDAFGAFVKGCNGVVHSALYHPAGWSEVPDLYRYLQVNLLGTISLIEAAISAGVSKFIFVSSCSVHDTVLDDRPLDERHPLYPKSHYGALKAATEAFVHSFGASGKIDICAIRPTGIYGLADPASDSKWYPLIEKITRGESVACQGGGKEVHAADVARAIALLLRAQGTNGQVYSCYDRYISEREVADIARDLTRSASVITGSRTTPRHEINTDKIRAIGTLPPLAASGEAGTPGGTAFTFGGEALLRNTVTELVAAAT